MAVRKTFSITSFEKQVSQIFLAAQGEVRAEHLGCPVERPESFHHLVVHRGSPR